MIAQLFKKIDDLIFEQVLKLKTSPASSKVQEVFNEFDDQIQRIIKYTLIILSVSIPFIIALVIAINIHHTKSEIGALKESLERIDNFIASKIKIKNSGVNFLAPEPINSQSDFTNRISLAAGNSNIDLANIQANDFNTENLPGSITKSIIAVKFSNLTSNQLFSMLLSLSQTQLIKYENIEILRDSQKSLLGGMITLNHFSKAPHNEN